MALTKDIIKWWYVILALVQLLYTTTFVSIFMEGPFREKIGLVIAANIAYHFAYGISLINRWQQRRMMKIGKFQNFALFGAKAFSIFFMLGGLLFTSLILIISINENDPKRALVLLVPMGLFIGGLGMWRFIRDELENK
jgi:hypothetical protein